MVMQQPEDTLQEAAAALATGSMSFDSLGLGEKRRRPREMMTWDMQERVAVTESQGLGRNSTTRRLLPIFDSPMPSQIGYVKPVQQALLNVQQGPLAMQPGHSIRTLEGTEGSALSLMEMENAGSAPVRDSFESGWATCLICNGIQDQETILTCQGCSYRTHVDCYFTAGSEDANDTITDAEDWRCEDCGGLGRHLHPRPVQGQRRNVNWTLADTSALGMQAGTGGFGGGRLGAPRTNIGSGKGKEPMPVDEDDRRLGNASMKGDESVINHINPSKRRRTHFIIPVQTEHLQAANVEDGMGLHIFDSGDRIQGTKDIATLDTDRATEDHEETRLHIFDSSITTCDMDIPGSAVSRTIQPEMATSTAGKHPRPRGKKSKPQVKFDHGGKTGRQRQDKKDEDCTGTKLSSKSRHHIGMHD